MLRGAKGTGPWPLPLVPLWQVTEEQAGDILHIVGVVWPQVSRSVRQTVSTCPICFHLLNGHGVGWRLCPGKGLISAPAGDGVAVEIGNVADHGRSVRGRMVGGRSEDLCCLAEGVTSAVGLGAASFGHAHHQLTLARAAGLEHGNLRGHTTSSEVGGDVEQVLGGGRHVGLFGMWLLYHRGGDPSQFPDHLLHLLSIDGRIIPCHTVTSGTKVATDLPIHHAALELLPVCLKAHLAVDHTRLSGVVEKLIVADPEGSIPGLVVGVAVHGLGSFGM